jgi:ubiquinone/menaquinone biosynthesis C-methylase UbiE
VILFNLEIMSAAKESAYRYDLFITPDWRDRFDSLITESIKIPLEGLILDVNCGTGAYAIELAERMKGKGEVIGVDPSADRLEIARAKALVKKAKDVSFEQGIASDLQFESHRYDVVIGDASMSHALEIPDVLAEMVRVVRPEGRVILKMATRGSFDEFFSVYWEALHDTGMDDAVWSSLERLINERHTLSEAEAMAEQSGLRNIESFKSREEFIFESAENFIEAPLIADYFLTEWIEIVPADRRDAVLERLKAIIERERHNATFDISIKATVIAGVK